MSESPAAPATSTDTDVFMTRTFDAPRDVVFRFWTDPALIAQWFGPDHWHTPVANVIIEPEIGGRFELQMVADDDSYSSWMRGRVEEYLPPELITVVVNVPASEQLAEMNVRLRVQFHDHGERTRITLHQGPFNNAMEVEQTIRGWGQSFGKLDALV